MKNKEQIKRRIYHGSPRLIQNIFWKTLFAFIEIKLSILASKNGIGSINNNGMIYIDPEWIKYSLTYMPSGEKYRNIGLVEDGNWDLNCIKIEDNKCFVALKEHFTKNIPLENTEFYKNILKKIETGEMYWGCKTKDELIKKLKNRDELYYNIKNSGYKTQSELGNNHLLDEITVNIGRNGEFLFEDGAHRFSIARLLKIEKIPVIVTKRHYQWVKFKNEIIACDKVDSGKAHQSLVHPDLVSIRRKKEI